MKSIYHKKNCQINENKYENYASKLKITVCTRKFFRLTSEYFCAQQSRIVGNEEFLNLLVLNINMY